MQHSPQRNQTNANILKGLAVLVAGLIGGFMSRWHGGGWIKGSPKILKAFLWSLPFTLASCAAFYLDGRGWIATSIATALVLAGCMVFKNTGHGGGMDLAHNQKEPDGVAPNKREPEKLEYLILWLHGKMPQYWYDALLLLIIGTASTLLPAIAIGMVNVWTGLIILASGMFGKPLGYMIGHGLADAGALKLMPYDLNHATAVGETMTGVFAYTCLAIGTMMAVLS